MVQDNEKTRLKKPISNREAIKPYETNTAQVGRKVSEAGRRKKELTSECCCKGEKLIRPHSA